MLSISRPIHLPHLLSTLEEWMLAPAPPLKSHKLELRSKKVVESNRRRSFLTLLDEPRSVEVKATLATININDNNKIL